MSIDARVSSDVQAVLDAFDRLGDEAKRDALARLMDRARSTADGAAPSPGGPGDDLDWGDLADEDHDRLAAEAFAALDREEEETARGERRTG
jgi:hypothetical protein